MKLKYHLTIFINAYLFMRYHLKVYGEDDEGEM